jgi:transcriptional regulator with XRE-family HTH domain
MPGPGPLGRLVRRRRLELELTQTQLSDRTADLGLRVPQNTLSRLESGATQRINNVAYINALAEALGYKNDLDFFVAAWGPKGATLAPPDSDLPDRGLLVRTLAVSFDLDEAERERLSIFVDHVRQTSTARGGTPEERIAAYARALAAGRG